MHRSPLRLGVIGLGRAFTLMLPTFQLDRRVQLVAAADPDPAAQRRFAEDIGGKAYAEAEALCADPDVEVVYVATPHQLHAEHVCLAAAHGKHVLVEKPMAITLEECQRMVAASETAGIHLIVGHSHSFDGPVQQARQLIDSGAYGAVRMITASYFTDFLYRPRRPEELDTQRGGGVVFNQAAHQMDVLRVLGGGRIRTVRAMMGAWDPARPTEGAYSALLRFENGAFATAVYSGYAHYDSAEALGWVAEMGHPKRAEDYGAARRRLADLPGAAEEARLKAASGYAAAPSVPPTVPPHHPHFGEVLVCCDGADLRLTPDGVVIYGDAMRESPVLPAPVAPRAEVIDELWLAVRDGVAPLHDGRWGLATTEACLALLQSAALERDVTLQHQVGLRPVAP